MTPQIPQTAAPGSLPPGAALTVAADGIPPCPEAAAREGTAPASGALVAVPPAPVPPGGSGGAATQDITEGASQGHGRQRGGAAWRWQDRAACHGSPLALFFGPDGEGWAAKAAREARAKLVCSACPVRTPCLAAALDGREAGVWGGTSEEERTSTRRRHARRRLARERAEAAA